MKLKNFPGWGMALIVLALVCWGAWNIASAAGDKLSDSSVKTRSSVELQRVKIADVGVDVVYQAPQPDGKVTLHAAGRGMPYVTYVDGSDLTDQGSGPAEAVLAGRAVIARTATLADLNEDHAQDLITGFVGASGGILTIRLGHQDGTFEPPMSYPVDVLPEFMALGRFDNDIHTDIVLGQSDVEALALLPGRGDGTFGQARQIELDGTPTALLAADFGRHDSLEELVAAVKTDQGSRLLMWQDRRGAVNANPRVMEVPSDVVALTSGYFTADWNLDLAVATADHMLVFSGSGPSSPRIEPANTVIEDDADFERCGTFEEDCDGQTTGAAPPINVRSAQWQRQFDHVEFDLFQTMSLSDRPTSLAVADFDGNRWDDLAVLHASTRQVALYRNQKGREFALHTQSIDSQPVGMTATNISGDRSFDLVLVDEANNQLGVMLGSPRGEFAAPVLLDVDSQPTMVVSGRMLRKAEDGLVVLKKGQGTTVLALPEAAGDITVTTLTDEFNQDNVVSLREAIFAANISQGPNTIYFSTGPGSMDVNGPALGQLPALSDTTGGTTIEGAGITIDGNNIGCFGCVGLKISSDGNTVNDLTIQEFDDDGLEVDPSNNNMFNAVIFTLNLGDGLEIDGDFNTATSCVAIDNDDDGFDVLTSTSNNNVFDGCLAISNDDEGFDIAGTLNAVTGGASVSNVDDGVDFNGGSSNNQVRLCAIVDNDEGVEVGDFMSASDGNTVGPENAIAVNRGDGGVDINQGTGNQVNNNTALSANLDDGVEIEDDGNMVFDNADISGNTDIAAGGGGVLIDGGNNNTVDPNTITGNTNDGVCIFGGTGNTVSQNSISGNTDLGIDLGNDGVGGGGGANNNQAAPVLTAACSDGVSTTHVEGTLTSTPSTGYTLEFFDNTACDPSGFGEGETYLGSATVMTDGAGMVAFSVNLPMGSSGAGITATATDQVTGDTSEFSNCLPPTPNSPPVANAGPDQSVDEGALVTLDGTGSTDPDLDPLTYSWMQTGGLPVALAGANTAMPTFTAPMLPDATCVVLTFQLTVTDICGNTDTDSVTINVDDVFVLQDEGTPGRCLRLRPCSGTYCWTGPEGTFTGPVALVLSDPTTLNIDSGAGDLNNLDGVASLSRRRGNSRLTVPGLGTFTIVDNNIDDSSCVCP